MFHQGDLQSGVAAALQTSKAVVCFITGSCSSMRRLLLTLADESELCNTWENEWLSQDKVRHGEHLEAELLTT
jgi:hypothetical protein